MNIVLDLKTLKKWMLDSLNTIKDKNNDAPLLGGFSGSIIEFLGRLLGNYGINKYPDCFKDFLMKYLPKYSSYGDSLYYFLRSDGAHNVLAQTAVDLTCDPGAKNFHLKCNRNPETDKHSLIIYSPEFMNDLIEAVEKFFSDIGSKPDLEKRCQEVFQEIYSNSQNAIKGKVIKGELKIESEIVISTE